MTLKKNKKNSTADSPLLTHIFPSSVTIENVEAQSTEIKNLNLESGATLTLDVSHTEIITTPGMQLLVALDKYLESINGKLKIYQPRAVFNDTCIALGLQALLVKWVSTS